MNRLIWACLFYSWAALGVQDGTFGLGGASSGRVSSVLAEPNNPFAAIYNPALLSVNDRTSFGFSTYFVGYGFDIPESVVRDSPKYRTRSAIPAQEAPDLSTDSQSLWAVGLAYPFAFPWLGRRVGLGLTASGPYQTLRTFTATTPYDFGVLRYGRAENQFKGTLGTAVDLWPGHLSLGAGLSLYITAAGSADANLVTENPTGRLAFDVGFHTAWLTGLFARAQGNSFALVYRESIHPTFEQGFTGRVQLERGTGTIDLPALLKTSLYFEPARLEFEWQREVAPFTISAGVSYQWWSAYVPSHLVIEAPGADGVLRRTEQPTTHLRNTVNPRLSLSVPLLSRRLLLSTGYSFRPSPVEDLSGPANLVDSNTHVVGLGLGYKLDSNGVLPFETLWSLSGQYHLLSRRDVRKAEQDFIGAPGYSFRGHAYSFGLSLQAQL